MWWNSGFQDGKQRRACYRRAPLLSGLCSPCQAGGGDEELPIPDVNASYAAGSARAEDLLVRSGVGEPLLLGQNLFGAAAVEVRGGHDGVPSVLGVLFGHHRQRCQIGYCSQGWVQTGESLGVKRGPFTGIAQKASQPLGLVAFNLISSPVQAADVVLHGGAHRTQVCSPQSFVSRAGAVCRARQVVHD
jgi:hypothetical protein